MPNPDRSSGHDRKVRIILRAALTLSLIALALPALATAATPAQHDAAVISFFRHHPKLAATKAGQREMWLVLAHLSTQLRSLQVERAKPKSNYDEARLAIYATFGTYADQAMRVAQCESRYDPKAQNGQYRGLFQFGDWAQTTYGFGPSWLEQAQAAFRYFKASGYRWTGWECQP